MSLTIHRSTLRDTDPATLYGVMRLRMQVFVVEQDCPYEDLDGRDLEPDAELHGTDVVGVALDPTALMRLAGAVVAEAWTNGPPPIATTRPGTAWRGSPPRPVIAACDQEAPGSKACTVMRWTESSRHAVRSLVAANNEWVSPGG